MTATILFFLINIIWLGVVLFIIRDCGKEIKLVDRINFDNYVSVLNAVKRLEERVEILEEKMEEGKDEIRD